MRDLLTLGAVVTALVVSWCGAAASDTKGRLAARQHLTVSREVAEGARLTEDDVKDIFGRVAGADSLLRARSDVVGRFATRTLHPGEPLYTGAVELRTAPPPDAFTVLFPILVRRGLLAGVTSGATVILVDSVRVVDADSGRPPYRGFTVQALVPAPDDTTMTTVVLRAHANCIAALQRLARGGATPVVLRTTLPLKPAQAPTPASTATCQSSPPRSGSTPVSQP